MIYCFFLFNTLLTESRILCKQVIKYQHKWGTKKAYRNIEIRIPVNAMEEENVESKLAPLRDHVKEQGDLVRALKSEGASTIDIKNAVLELNARKKKLEEMELALSPPVEYFDRSKMEDLLKRRFFYDQSFAIYGGVAGLFDYGPMGCALKNNLLDMWRKFFVREEQMLEVDCSVLTPEPVLKASGHVDRFADLMVKDLGNGECFRLDHLIKGHLEKLAAAKDTSAEMAKDCRDCVTKLDGMTKVEMETLLRKYNMRSPLTGNELSPPMEFNLMFGTQIGPSGMLRSFLRPETAQGIFVNFKRLLEFNQGRLPFAAAQVGQAFRNEISPRSGLIRVREFTMAEIEHFCDPHEKNTHHKFDSIANESLLLFSANNQMDGLGAKRMTIGEAVRQHKLVANETLGYFLGRIHQFLVKCGVDERRLRFRQHLPNEMAHYAQDCWDAECLTSYGWIECVGCADRSAYDLTQHTQATGIRLVAEKKLPQPKEIDIFKAVPNKGVLGKKFKKDVKLVSDYLAALSIDELKGMEQMLNSTGVHIVNINDSEFELDSSCVSMKREVKTVHVEEIIPSVIEPSFGVGRIMYAIFEHNFKMRDSDDQRTFLTLPPSIAPIKCSILPLSANAEFVPFIKSISADLSKAYVSYKIDDSSGSIGRRYARTDEIAIPYGITIDFDTLTEPHSVTLRERDSMDQVRLPLLDVAAVVQGLTDGTFKWTGIQEKYPKFEQQDKKNA